MTEILMWT